jgi:hypothetical protein
MFGMDAPQQAPAQTTIKASSNQLEAGRDGQYGLSDWSQPEVSLTHK